MIGMWDGSVVLRLTSGRRVSVPLDGLNAESRIQAKQVAAGLAQARQSLSSELQTAAQAEAAPAPDPLPEPPATNTYAPVQPNLPPDQAFAQIQEQLRAGHLIAIYDAMPLSYRNEFDSLVKLVMRKLEPTSWDDSMAQTHRVAELIVTRQNWIRSYPRLTGPESENNNPNAVGEVFQNMVLPVASYLRAALAPDQTTTVAIGASSFGDWLRQRDQASAPYLAVLISQYGTSAPNWMLGEGGKDQVILQAQGPASSKEGAGMLSIEMKKVDGYWIPASLADGFSDWVKEQTVALEKYEDGSMSVSAWLGGQAVGMSSLASASNNTSDAFDSSMSGEFSGSDEADYARQMAEEQMRMEMEMSTSGSESSSDGSSGYSAVPQGKAAEFAPAPVDAETIGTVLQSIGVLGGMAGPLESASDASMFHAAMEQLVSPLAALADMFGS
ncbi:hypothetical protein [Neorhodopirellula pilleata]|nr:hypothetical protein [Neorhodopirellula pilleata]